MGALIDLTGNTHGDLFVVERAETINGDIKWRCRCTCGVEKVIDGHGLRSGATTHCGCKSFIDENGNIYGKLTVLSKEDGRISGQVSWLCQCDCGNTTIVRGSSLRTGATSSCGCLRGNGTGRPINEVGNRYGRLKVLRRCGSSEKGQATWICKCDCGNDFIASGTYLRAGYSKSCGCLQIEARRVAAFNKLMQQFKWSASDRNLEFSLSRDFVRKITKQKCFYCGIEPRQCCSLPSVSEVYIYNGIDRVDNAIGYIEDNVVPCCSQCNIAKRDHSVENFLSWSERVYNHSIGAKI